MLPIREALRLLVDMLPGGKSSQVHRTLTLEQDFKRSPDSTACISDKLGCSTVTSYAVSTFWSHEVVTVLKRKVSKAW